MHRRNLSYWKSIFSAVFVFGCSPLLFAQGTAFTYQGRLLVNSSAVTGNYDMQFKLHPSPSTAIQVGPTLTNSPVGVTNGLFVTTLDFGNVFDGTPLWLEVGVRANGSASNFVILSPAQPLTPAPYAVRAENAGSALAYTGAVSDAQLSTNVARFNAGGVFTGPVVFSNATGNLSGNGINLTNLTLGTPLIPPGAVYTNNPALGVATYAVPVVPGQLYWGVITNDDNFITDAEYHDSSVLPNQPYYSLTGLISTPDTRLYAYDNGTNLLGQPVQEQIYALSTNMGLFQGGFQGTFQGVFRGVFQDTTTDSSLYDKYLWNPVIPFPPGGANNITLWGGSGVVPFNGANINWVSDNNPNHWHAALGINLAHGNTGVGGDNSEWSIAANQIALVGLTAALNVKQMVLQFGGAGHFDAPDVFYFNHWVTTGSYHLSGLQDFRYGYSNGPSSFQIMEIYHGISRVDVASGNGTLSTFDPHVNVIGMGEPGIYTTNSIRQDIIGNTGVKNYGALILDTTNTSAPGTVYCINMGMMSQTLTVTQPITLSVTNWDFITNTWSDTASGIASDVYLFSSSPQTLTFSIPAPLNAIWESEAGGASAPGSVNGMLHLRAYLVVANSKTNLILNAKH